jgi:hypothetical protein
MFRYFGFGLTIDSEVELPDLSPGHEEPDVVIRIGPVPRTPRKATLDDEIAITHRGGAFHIRHGREIVLDPAPGANPELLRVLLMGRMMAYLLRQRGWLSLHASGVRIDGRAVLFLGVSGSGKSTTVAAFHSRGHQVITDDVGAVRVCATRQCVLRPQGSRIRLLDDSRAVFEGVAPSGVFQWDKHTFDLANGDQQELVPVARIYALEYGGAISSEGIKPLPAVALLSEHSFVRRRGMTREALAAHLSACSSVAGAVPVCKLVRPRSLAALPDLVRWVEADTKAARPASLPSDAAAL